jgi:hypothetical protein
MHKNPAGVKKDVRQLDLAVDDWRHGVALQVSLVVQDVQD